jgi:hypothetical protein
MEIPKDNFDDQLLPYAVKQAVGHFAAHVSTKSAARRDASLSSRTSDYKLVAFHYQAVAGANFHIVMSTRDTSRRTTYMLEGVIHRDMAGVHSVTHQEPLRTADEYHKANSNPGTVDKHDTIDNKDNRGGNVPVWVVLVVSGVALALVAVAAGIGFVIGSQRVPAEFLSPLSPLDVSINPVNAGANRTGKANQSCTQQGKAQDEAVAPSVTITDATTSVTLADCVTVARDRQSSAGSCRERSASATMLEMEAMVPDGALEKRGNGPGAVVV